MTLSKILTQHNIKTLIKTYLFEKRIFNMRQKIDYF